MNVTSFENTWAAVKSTSKFLNFEEKIYSERPRNKYEPAHSMWWLVPSPEWPCYRFGKFVFTEASGYLNCGIHVEKGWGKTALQSITISTKDRYLMNETWMWSTFLHGLESGEVSESIHGMQRDLGQPVILSIHASPIGDTSKHDPYGADRGFYFIKFRVDDDGFVLQDDSEAGPLSLLKKADDMRDIPSLLGRINSNGLDLEWFWIDFYIFIDLRIVNQKDASTQDKIFDAKMIYDRILVPLDKWCGSGK